MNHYEKPESFLLKIEYTKCLKKNLSLTYKHKKTKHDSEKIPLRDLKTDTYVGILLCLKQTL